jgi:hypothetical protein
VQAELASLTRLGVKVFGFNQAEGPSHEAFAKELGLTFPLNIVLGIPVYAALAHEAAGLLGR